MLYDSVAAPAVVLTAAVPTGLAPTRNCTAPAAAGLTVALRVTGSPYCPDAGATLVVVGWALGGTRAMAVGMLVPKILPWDRIALSLIRITSVELGQLCEMPSTTNRRIPSVAMSSVPLKAVDDLPTVPAGRNPASVTVVPLTL